MMTHLCCYASLLCVRERYKQQDLDGLWVTLKTRRNRRYMT